MLTFVEDQRGRVRRLEFFLERIALSYWNIGVDLLKSGVVCTLMEIRETAGRVFKDKKR